MLPLVTLSLMLFLTIACEAGSVVHGKVVLPGEGSKSTETGDVQLALVPLEQATNRWAKLGQGGDASATALKLADERKSIEAERTKLVYRSMFSEVGPAEKQELREAAARLDARLAEIEEKSHRAQERRLSTNAPSFFREQSVFAVAKTRSLANGMFTIEAPAGELAVVGCRTQAVAGETNYLWVLSVDPASRAALFLTATNATAAWRSFP